MKTAVVLKPTYITQSSTESTSRIYREIEPRNDIKRLLSDPHFEGFRKSGSDVQLQPSGNQSIIFKILDNDGSSRVEIKINNKKKRKKTRNLRDNSRQRFPRNDTNVRELSNLTKDTVLILLPNNTLVYEVKEPDTLIKIEAESDVTMIKEYLRENPLLLTKGLEVPNSSKLVEEITISDSLYVTLETRTENATTLVEDVTEVIEPIMAAQDPVILAEALPAEDPVMSAEDNMMPIEDATLQAERTQTLVKDIKTLNKLDLERANEILLDNSLGKAELERYLGSIPTLTSKTTHDSYQMSHEE
ncbi:uncharacterized protein LOC126369479 [Pectinophora gossypiella]|uniref:uncharacterized protein LOC126369479 n=1 Tax=Pectinophora gossypiella TaxID=13191 RepID=UPI00214E4F8E|nr:uncharacterized protein LOC126369479 [Pectinophora gossypiella]